MTNGAFAFDFADKKNIHCNCCTGRDYDHCTFYPSTIFWRTLGSNQGERVELISFSIIIEDMAIMLPRTLRHAGIVALLFVGGVIIFATILYMMAYFGSFFYASSYYAIFGESVFFLALGSLVIAVGLYLIKVGRAEGANL